MSSDRSSSRWGELFRLGSIAGSPHEAEAFVQQRVGLYFAVLFTLSALMFVVSAVFNTIAREPFLVSGRFVHFALVLVTFVLWRIARRNGWPLWALSMFDVGGTLCVCVLGALLAACIPERGLPDYLAFLLALTQTLVARAAIVPSDPLRTLALGCVGSLPLFLSAYFGPDVIDPHTPSWANALNVGVWGGLAAVLTSVISRVIYGLRQQVEEIAHLGQYTLIERIGAGGMGTVYRARHGMLRRPTAVKLLPLERAGAQAIARFEREVQLTAALNHPNIVGIYDFGRTPDGIFYYAMEYLDGIDLEALVKADGAQPPGRVVHILKQVAAALADAHAAGLIHRDIKPANIVLSERRGIADLAKVVDFGLVKELVPQDALLLSGSHSFVGTPLYTAPESLVSPDNVDARSDLYSLGAVAYFLLTARPVFEAKTAVEVYAQHLYEPVTPPSTWRDQPLPAGLDALVLACLEKAPEKRPNGARELLSALECLHDVPGWSTTDATAWWSQHGEALRRARRPHGEPISARTLAVDPRGREPESSSTDDTNLANPAAEPRTNVL